MSLELNKLAVKASTVVTNYVSKYPLFGQQYHWIMGSELENARILMNEQQNQMQQHRLRAYELQDCLIQKEAENRTMVETLRHLKKTSPEYMERVGEEVALLADIEQLHDELAKHQQIEQVSSDQWQQSIVNYHRLDNEYKERLKRISYSWSIVWMVFSVGIGGLWAYRLRHNFLADLRMLSATNEESIASLIDSAMQKQQTLNSKGNELPGLNDEGGSMDLQLLEWMETMEHHQEIIANHLDEVLHEKATENDPKEKYLWMFAGMAFSVVSHSILLWFQSQSSSPSSSTI